MFEQVQANLCSPITLMFVLGIVARLIRSELKLPPDLYASLAIYLLLAIGLKGGIEVSKANLADLTWPALAAVALGCVTPITTFVVLRFVGRFSLADSAGIAAHYGSVSAVTFIAVQQFLQQIKVPCEAYMPALLALMEIPGIQVAIAMGTMLLARQSRHERDASSLQLNEQMEESSCWKVIHELVTSRSMVLMVGGFLIGMIAGETGCKPVLPVFDGLFKGLLCLFLLELGLVTGSYLNTLRSAGPFLVVFGMVMPIIHGALGAYVGSRVGLSVGGTTILATMTASASYIAAPTAVRMALPQANPTLYLTAALGITFPFNLVVGLPIYLGFARYFCGYSG